MKKLPFLLDVPNGIHPRVRIKANWEDRGKIGTLILTITLAGQRWSAIIWDDEEDPDWHKTSGLEDFKGKDL